jgi:hypothetical protein
MTKAVVSIDVNVQTLLSVTMFRTVVNFDELSGWCRC